MGYLLLENVEIVGLHCEGRLLNIHLPRLQAFLLPTQDVLSQPFLCHHYEEYGNRSRPKFLAQS